MRVALLLSAALLMAALPVCSQLCTGSLGDPVVHIDFGRGGVQGSPVASATTTYSFLNSDCPNDGSYTIRSSINACFSNTWHTVNEDHTPGDAGGHMMVVNASFQPGDCFVDTVSGLCANTTYELAAWVLNVLLTSACGGGGIDPNLTFKIETIT